MENPLEMVIFNSYVSHYQRVSVVECPHDGCLIMDHHPRMGAKEHECIYTYIYIYTYEYLNLKPTNPNYALGMLYLHLFTCTLITSLRNL